MADTKLYPVHGAPPGISIVAGRFSTADGYSSIGTGWSVDSNGLGLWTITHDAYPELISGCVTLEDTTANSTARAFLYGSSASSGYTYIKSQTSAGTDADPVNSETINFILIFRNTDLTA